MGRANWTFEEQWSRALEDAEVTPPAQVWVAIDGQLANDQAMGYKRQADFYRWVAAACLFLFTLGGAIYWFSGSGAVDYEVVSNESILQNDEKKDLGLSPSIMLDDDSAEEKASDSDKSKELAVTKDQIYLDNSDHSEQPTSDRSFEVPTKEVQYQTAIKKNESEWLSIAPKPTHLPAAVEPWETTQLYGVARTWEEIEDEKSFSPLWAGVSFSAGAFDPGFSKGEDLVFASEQSFTTNEIVAQEPSTTARYSAGQSVAGGINVGKKIHKRIVLSSGVQYSAFNTGSVNSQVVADTQSSNNYALTSETDDRGLESALSEGNLRYSGEEVQLANEYEYLTVPIQAGYILLDRKFNITLNTGLSSNFLINSRLVSDGESESLDNDFATTHNYESIYFNFLTSVEFGYVFKQHYHFLVAPNYNQALTNFTSSNHTNPAKPKNVGVTIGFRYNF